MNTQLISKLTPEDIQKLDFEALKHAQIWIYSLNLNRCEKHEIMGIFYERLCTLKFAVKDGATPIGTYINIAKLCYKEYFRNIHGTKINGTFVATEITVPEETLVTLEHQITGESANHAPSTVNFIMLKWALCGTVAEHRFMKLLTLARNGHSNARKTLITLIKLIDTAPCKRDTIVTMQGILNEFFLSERQDKQQSRSANKSDTTDVSHTTPTAAQQTDTVERSTVLF